MSLADHYLPQSGTCTTKIIINKTSLPELVVTMLAFNNHTPTIHAQVFLNTLTLYVFVLKFVTYE